MSKSYLIVGNWKMNFDVHEASVHLHNLEKSIKTYKDVEVVFTPSLIHLQPLTHQLDHRRFKLAAQNAYFKDSGAFTGEVSYSQLRGLVDYAIVGHSERRLYFNESLEIVRDKVAAAIRNGITPILCVGETQQERNLQETRQVLHDQLTTALSNLTSDDFEKVVVAYEPVWAISTFGGVLAKPAEVEKEFAYIRNQVTELYGKKAAEDMRLLYGGSVDDQIARGYLELDDCNGALVGGASLNHLKFAGVVEAAHALAREKHGT